VVKKCILVIAALIGLGTSFSASANNSTTAQAFWEPVYDERRVTPCEQDDYTASLVWGVKPEDEPPYSYIANLTESDLSIEKYEKFYMTVSDISKSGSSCDIVGRLYLAKLYHHFCPGWNGHLGTKAFEEATPLGKELIVLFFDIRVAHKKETMRATVISGCEYPLYNGKPAPTSEDPKTWPW